VSSEVLLHGYEHHQPTARGIHGICKGNELRGLSSEVVHQRLRKGQRDLAEFLGKPANGFLAPAYERGAASDALLADCGLSYYLGWKRLQRFSGASVRLATYVWDVDPKGVAGRVGEYIGHAARVRPGAIPAIALHPKDVDRGYLQRAVALATRLVDRGYRAASPSDLLSHAPSQVPVHHPVEV
jgi:predicted deacetylase